MDVHGLTALVTGGPAGIGAGSRSRLLPLVDWQTALSGGFVRPAGYRMEA